MDRRLLDFGQTLKELTFEALWLGVGQWVASCQGRSLPADVGDLLIGSRRTRGPHVHPCHSANHVMYNYNYRIIIIRIRIKKKEDERK